ncbi:MAG: hypothetical protein QW511_05535 [Candidatus Methanomethylicia archaeon]
MLSLPEEFVLIINSIFSEAVLIFPKIAFSIIIAVLILLLIKLLNKFIKWMVKIFNLEQLINSLIPGGLRASLTTLIMMFADLGLLMVGVAMICRIIIVDEQLYTSIILYTSRIISIAILTLIFIISLDAFMKYVKIERKLENTLVLIILLLVIIVLIDLTSLSSEIKYAIGLGVSIGLGLILGIFVFWLLFKDYIEVHIKTRN